MVSITVATTTITILRPPEADDAADPYDEPTSPLETVATGVPATFSSPSGSENGATGSQEDIEWRLLADPCDLQHHDTVVDDTTAERYGVTWTHARPDPDGDLAHVVAGVTRVVGASASGGSTAGGGRR